MLRSSKPGSKGAVLEITDPPVEMLPDTDPVGEGRTRLMALPAETRDRLACLACLGGEVAPALLAAACDIGVEGMWQDLAPALDDGLVLTEAGVEGAEARLRFRDEAVRQSVFACMEAGAPQAWHLSLARRLAPLAEYADAAVEQYLHAVAAIHDPEEAETACALFAAAAARGVEDDTARRYQAALAEVRAQSGVDVPATDEASSPPAESPPPEPVDLLAVLHASQALSAQTTVGGLQAQVRETLATITGATAVLLVVWDDDSQAWYLAPALDERVEPVAEAAARGALPLSAFRTVEQTRAPLVIDDAMLDENLAADPYFAGVEHCALLVLPVQSQGADRAILIVENRLGSAGFSPACLESVTLIAGQLAVSLENARLYATLERRLAKRTEALAVVTRRLELFNISDALTGLANRRRFDELLAREWLRALRAGTGIGLVMVDIDYFSRYNDHYGHLGGDQCLRAVATALRAHARHDMDMVARYGGEEFALIVPGATMDAASMVAHRAHSAVRALREPHGASPFGIITVSAGVAACMPAEDMTQEQLIAMAESALHRAKRFGRNRVAYAPVAPMLVTASAQ